MYLYRMEIKDVINFLVCLDFVIEYLEEFLRLLNILINLLREKKRKSIELLF